LDQISRERLTPGTNGHNQKKKTGKLEKSYLSNPNQVRSTGKKGQNGAGTILSKPTGGEAFGQVARRTSMKPAYRTQAVYQRRNRHCSRVERGGDVRKKESKDSTFMLTFKKQKALSRNRRKF